MDCRGGSVRRVRTSTALASSQGREAPGVPGMSSWAACSELESSTLWTKEATG